MAISVKIALIEASKVGQQVEVKICYQACPPESHPWEGGK